MKQMWMLRVAVAAMTTAALAGEPAAQLQLGRRGEEPFWPLQADGATGRLTEARRR